MKIKALALSAMSAMLLASCSGGSSDKCALTDKSTPTDSLSYVFGQMAGMQRGVSFEQDTTLRGDDAHKAYDQGFKDGFKLLKGDDDAYNQGLLLGLQLAMQMQDLNRNSGIQLNRDLVLNGFNTTVAADSVDPRAYQQIQERGARLISSIMGEKVKVKVDELAKKGKYQQKQGVYYIENKPGSGANLAKGQQAVIKFNIMDKTRKELIPGMKDQETPWEVGSGQLPVLDKVLPMMKVGSVYEVLLSPQQAFGAQMPPMVDQNEPVIITIEVVSLGQPKAAGNDSVPAQQPAK